MKYKVFILHVVLLIFVTAGNAYAGFSCYGKITQLGIDGGGDVAVSLTNSADSQYSTPIHKMCNVNSKGSFTFNEASCKAAYSAFLSAKVSGQQVKIFYSSTTLSCSTLPSWGQVTNAYFVEGPF